jgi:hypothetical protein
MFAPFSQISTLRAAGARITSHRAPDALKSSSALKKAPVLAPHFNFFFYMGLDARKPRCRIRRAVFECAPHRTAEAVPTPLQHPQAKLL